MNEIGVKEYNLVKLLCKRNGFNFDFIGKYIRFTTKADQWLIENDDYSKKKIKLYHQNKYGSASFHHQGSMGSFSNLYKVFAYMKNHESKISKSHEQVFRMKALFESLHVKN